MNWATWALERWIFALKYRRKIRHGYMYAIRTYNHGRFYRVKKATSRQIHGLNLHWVSSLTWIEPLELLRDQFLVWNIGEKYPMVIYTHGCIYNHERIWQKILYFKALKILYWALHLFTIMSWTTWPLNLWVFSRKY